MSGDGGGQAADVVAVDVRPALFARDEFGGHEASLSVLLRMKSLNSESMVFMMDL